MGFQSLEKLKMNTFIVVLSSVLIQAQSFSSSNYGILKPFKPLEDLNIPEQGPGILIPQERRRSFALTTNSYGVPLAPVAPFAPVEDLNLPDQGPGFLVPQTSRSLTTNAYGVPVAPVTPVAPFAPVEDLNIPDQGPGLLVPQGQRTVTTNGYGVPLAPVAPVRPFAPLEDLNIPNQGPGLLVPQDQRTVTTNGYVVPLAPLATVAPISDIDLPQQVAPPVFAPILYQYQYETENSARQEVRDENGLTQGFYSYVDPNGQVQRVDYVSDPTLGYRVLNPVQAVQDTPEVTKAKEKFFKAYNLALQNNL